MDISRAEQRILHLLAQGGRIDIEKDDNRKIMTVACITRDGWRASGLDIDLFRKLKRRRKPLRMRTSKKRSSRFLTA